MIRPLCAFAAAALCVACADDGTGPDPLPLQTAEQSAGPVVAIANGSGHRVRSDRLLTFAFTARLHADGSADGNYHVDFQNLGVSFDVDVTCMSVDGNRAWIGGIIRNVVGPIVQEGTVSYFYVTDNGEGADAVDGISGVRVNDAAGEDQLFCDQQLTLLTEVPIERGNAQVKTF